MFGIKCRYKIKTFSARTILAFIYIAICFRFYFFYYYYCKRRTPCVRWDDGRSPQTRPSWSPTSSQKGLSRGPRHNTTQEREETQTRSSPRKYQRGAKFENLRLHRHWSKLPGTLKSAKSSTPFIQVSNHQGHKPTSRYHQTLKTAFVKLIQFVTLHQNFSRIRV